MSRGARPRSRTPGLAAATWGLIPAVAAGAAAAIEPQDLTDELVRSAAGAIVEDLYRRKDPQRFWDPPSWDPDRDGQSSQAGGYTPLVVLALLHAGESYQQPRLRDAVDHLTQQRLEGTYAVAVRAHVWALLPDKFRANLDADVRWLMEGFHPEPGGWSYRQQPRAGWFDNSLAQYGALALWEAAKRDRPIPDRFWRRLEQRFLAGESPDGGWNYRGNQPVTGSMTAAGLTTLFITQDFLHARDAVELSDAPAGPHESALARGLAWMDEHFSPRENPGKDTYFFYYLYGVERVGLASGYTTFGGRDWYRAGAAEIINRLCSVDPETGAVTVHARLRARETSLQVRQLAFALMFLSRGRVPVAINKLAAEGVAWNNRPRDVANLTRWIREQTETDVNWQIVSLDEEPRSWLDAPVLYLASDRRLPWPGEGAELPPPLAKLKRYLDLGGMLLAVNEGRSPLFARSIEQAGTLMYPGYAWRTLPRSHWVYSLHFPARGRRPALRGLSNGVRELIILAPGNDLSATFQARDETRPAAWTTAAHVYLHASEKNRPRPRLARHATAARREPSPHEKVLSIVRASYDGNWNPEPMALPVFAEAMAESRGLRVRLRETRLSELAGLDPPPDLVIVSGVDEHRFTETQGRAIAECVEAGGVILFETAGGRGVFARAAEAWCAERLGQPPVSLLDSPIITGDGLPGAVTLSRLEYRPYAREVFAAHDTTPRLRGIVIDGEARVLFSREDISHGLLDQPSWGITGYAPESSRNLLGNILEYAGMSR